MTYTQADIERLQAREEMFRTEWADLQAGVWSFESRHDYDAFRGQWQENTRRLDIALQQQGA